MNTKIASDESNLENINIFNRPMNIASDYELLASNEWLGAKTELDEQFTDDEDSKIKFLCDIMLVSCPTPLDIVMNLHPYTPFTLQAV